MKRLVLVLLMAASARAATLVVAPDDVMVRASEAIVVATAQTSHGRWPQGRWIETVTTMRVDEPIKGAPQAGETFDLVELGGIVGHTGLAVSGSPRFRDGEQVLLFLDHTDQGDWTARTMAAGVFRFEGELLVRRDVCGFEREAPRLAAPFLDFVRATARGIPGPAYQLAPLAAPDPALTATPTITSYLLTDDGDAGTLGMRWNRFPGAVVFLSHGTQPGALNGGLTAVNRSLAVWTNDGASNIVYQYGGTTARDSGFIAADGVSSIQFNDPSSEIPGSFTGRSGDILAVGGAWFDTTIASTHEFGGERFYTIFEADLIIQNGVTGSGLTGNGFDHVLAHELGHTLGLRHSDEPPPGGLGTVDALMNSSVDFNNDRFGAALRPWDSLAIAAVYGSAPACTPPAITTQPKSLELVRPDTVTLSVAASGTGNTFQWYVGSRGNTTAPIGGGTSAALTVTPQSTTSYWVRVANGCDPPADSDTAIVTIAGCPAVQIDATTQSTTILQTRSITLEASAHGGVISYQWFAGASGDTKTQLAATATFSVTPSKTTSYWVRATNTCGAKADSPTITITVVPCDAPKIAISPSGGDVVVNDTIVLSATVTGTSPLTLQWYQGALLDFSHPAGTGTSITAGPITSPTTFWVQATNDCGSATSAAATVTLVPSCVAPAIVFPPQNVNVARGTTATLSLAANGTSLLYRWYQGAVLDFTHPVGTSAPALVTPTVDAVATYWVRITNSCGAVNSAAVTVTPVKAKQRAIGR